MLSLPGYSYSQHYEKRHGQPAPDFERPTRAQVADYFAAYPEEVGIADVIHTSTTVTLISRTKSGFDLLLKNGDTLSCNHLVLATGIFTLNYPPPPLLQPLCDLKNTDPNVPLLVIGSGFTAADVILSQPPNRKILHIFHWDPEFRPSPLKGCHHQAYPEYAGVYRQMKLAALSLTAAKSLPQRRKGNPFFNQREWASVYEGLPNAEITNVEIPDPASNIGTVTIRLQSGQSTQRTVGGLVYVTGRRGSLAYLSRALLREVIGDEQIAGGASGLWISSKTIREKAEKDLEVAPNVFLVGSLTGDSLVRHAYGGCVYAAGRIMGVAGDMKEGREEAEGGKALPLHPMRQDVVLDGKVFSQERQKRFDNYQDLHLDRPKGGGGE